MSMSGRPLRILHVPVDLGGHPRALAAAQRQLGHDALCISLAYSPLGFNGDECLDAPLGSKGRLWRRELGRWRLLWRSLVNADVIHCHFGQSVMAVRPLPLRDPAQSGLAESLTVAYAKALWLSDVKLWRGLGKPVTMSFYGDDARLTDIATSREPFSHLHEPEIAAPARRRDAGKLQLFAELQRLGVAMFATNPDLLAGLPEGARFQPYCHVDVDLVDVRPPSLSGPLRFVHMPTDRAVKGTASFISAVEQLQAEGHDVTLTLVERRSNAEALAILGEHDVLLDQLRVGWYGAVAVEAMARGKPVVAHLNAQDVALTDPVFQRDLPLLRATPHDVLDILRRLVTAPRSAIVAMGAASRTFAARWHDPRAVALDALRVYTAS